MRKRNASKEMAIQVKGEAFGYDGKRLHDEKAKSDETEQLNNVSSHN
jgi:hypothetical protein